MKLYSYARYCLFILLLLEVGAAAIAQQVAPAMKTALDQLIDAHFKPDEPGGTVLIAQKGSVVYKRAFGLSNLALHAKMEADMLFQIGSQTKQFTAICILQLMEQGKLAVTDPISKYIDHSPAAWQSVTIEHLMTHSSGIPDVSSGARRGPSTAEVVAAAQQQPLSYVPGTKTVYANVEFVLLEVIVEKVSGQPLGAYVKAHILEPLGMTHTYLADIDTDVPNFTPAYLRRGAGFAVASNPSGFSGAGGLISNTQDMLTWYTALAAGKVVTKASLAQAWKAYSLADGTLSRFGYGWKAGGAVQGSPMIEHNGLAIGYTTECFYLPAEEVFVAVFLNQRGYADAVAQHLAAIFINKPYPMDSIPMPDTLLQSLTGLYHDPAGQERHFDVHAGKVYYVPRGAARLQMVFYGQDKFYFHNTLMMGTVQYDAAGKVAALELFDKRYQAATGWVWKKL